MEKNLSDNNINIVSMKAKNVINILDIDAYKEKNLYTYW